MASHDAPAHIFDLDTLSVWPIVRTGDDGPPAFKLDLKNRLTRMQDACAYLANSGAGEPTRKINEVWPEIEKRIIPHIKGIPCFAPVV